MEDASIQKVDLADNNSLFAVFDGHGGTLHLIKVLRLANMFKPNLLIF